MLRVRTSRWRWFSLAAIVAALMAAAWSPAPTFVERWYSQRFYPALQHVVTPVTNLVPVATLDLLMAVALIAVIVGGRRAVSVARHIRRLTPVVLATLTLVSASAMVYLVFLGLWGWNYRRVPMTARIVMDDTPARTEPVMQLGLRAVESLNGSYDDAHRRGWNEQEWRETDLVASARAVQTHLAGTSAVPGRLKRSVLGLYFRWAGIDGMVNPFGLEVIANPDLLPFERPFVAAHEWAHLAGFADESEANFIGFLTCVRADAPARYSAWLYLYWQIAAEVDATSRSRLWAALASGPRQDVDAIADRLRRGELPRLRVVSWLVYDQYLKMNRIPSGVRNYGEVINLLVRARFDDDWLPAVRQR